MIPRRRFSVGLITILLLVSARAQAQTSVRVNVGGPQYTDAAGNTWQADNGCQGGTNFTASGSISGTTDPTLYRTGKQSGAFSCTYSVTAPTFYYVTVRFAETSPSISVRNPRIFNVFVNNIRQAQVNIVGNGGAPYTASDLTFGPIAIYDGTVNILFSSVSNAAEVQAIDIEAAQTIGPINTSNLQINQPAGTSPTAYWMQAGLNRFSWFTSSDGTQFLLGRYSDLGVFIDTPISILRSSGVITLNSSLFASGALVANGAGLFVLPLSNARPTCSVTTRSEFWATQAASMSADTVAVCAKDNMDVYAWRTIY